MRKMRLTILYDNEAKKGMKKGHGFACLIEGQTNILVDTGWDGQLLFHNMKQLGIPLDEIDSVFLTHDHWDHIGGLASILHLNKNCTVFCPKGFSKHLKREVQTRATVKEISRATQITTDACTTGELGTKIKEQSLIIQTEKGNVIVTGCSHPGLGLIINTALKFGEIYGVIGGFHGFNQYPILDQIQQIIPCHCTQHKTEIQKRYPHRCEIGYAGKIVTI